jgi:hypothetical protein
MGVEDTGELASPSVLSSVLASVRLHLSRGRKPHKEAAKSKMAKIRIVLRTPNIGMNQSTGRKAPSKLPTVEIAYNDPLTRPLLAISFVIKRTAKGETRPRSVTGTAKSSMVPMSELRKILTDICAIAVIDQDRIGLDANGIMSIATAAMDVIVHRTRSDGCRSARRPPMKYPTVR